MLKGRRTELGFLNGYVVEQASKVGIEAPYCKAVIEWVGANPEFSPDPKNIDAVADLLSEECKAALEAFRAQM